MARQAILGDLQINNTGIITVSNFSIKNQSNINKSNTIFGKGIGVPMSEEPQVIDVRFIVSDYDRVFSGFLINGNKITALDEVYDYINLTLKKSKTIFFFSYSDLYGNYVCQEADKDYKKIDTSSGNTKEYEVILKLVKTSDTPEDDFSSLLSPDGVIGASNAELLSGSISALKSASETGKTFAGKIRDGVTSVNVARAKVSEAILTARDSVTTVKDVLQNIQNTVNEVEATIRDAELLYKNLENIGAAIVNGDITSLDDLINLTDLINYSLDISYDITNRYSLLNIL